MVNKSEFEKIYNSLSAIEVAEIYNINPSTVSKWARKFNIPRKCNKYIDLEDLCLSDVQMQVIIGSLLGDGCLEKVCKIGRNSRFTEGHGLLQKEWLQWKQNILGDWVSNFTYLKSKDRESYRLKTIVHPKFNDLENQWYQRDEFGNYILKKVSKRFHRIKIVPKNLTLTPLSLAVWYLDDGYNQINHSGCIISTLGFVLSEIEFLIDKIKSFNIENCHPLKQDKQGQGYVIRIGKSSYNDFIELIKKSIADIPQCMQYKIN